MTKLLGSGVERRLWSIDWFSAGIAFKTLPVLSSCSPQIQAHRRTDAAFIGDRLVGEFQKFHVQCLAHGQSTCVVGGFAKSELARCLEHRGMQEYDDTGSKTSIACEEFAHLGSIGHPEILEAIIEQYVNFA
jgi:nitroreductase